MAISVEINESCKPKILSIGWWSGFVEVHSKTYEYCAAKIQKSEQKEMFAAAGRDPSKQQMTCIERNLFTSTGKNKLALIYRPLKGLSANHIETPSRCRLI